MQLYKGNLVHPSYCCQKCGELVGWFGRVFFFLHKCKLKDSLEKHA